ncbi:MAG TPA: hypothetical protein VK530_08725 [Candidatus Acidoferrum sp.]|nr:hypothetical protein [Candidatus Acidoferrum sp.]
MNRSQRLATIILIGASSLGLRGSSRNVLSVAKPILFFDGNRATPAVHRKPSFTAPVQVASPVANVTKPRRLPKRSIGQHVLRSALIGGLIGLSIGVVQWLTNRNNG